ncbi:MAG: TetR/AcrR family transcriptional regulator [Clostridium sp.]
MAKKSEKTKQILKETFINLVKEKGIAGVTVTDIVTKLDFNRGTFYLHYQDKYELLEEIEDSIISSIKIIINDTLLENINTLLPRDNDILQILLCKIYTYIKNSSQFIGVLLGPNGDLSFQWKVKALIEGVLIRNLQIMNITNSIPSNYMSIIASSSQIGVIQKWIKGGFQESPEELALFMTKVIHSIFQGVWLDEINNPK